MRVRAVLIVALVATLGLEAPGAQRGGGGGGGGRGGGGIGGGGIGGGGGRQGGITDPRAPQSPDEIPVFRGAVTIVDIDVLVTDAEGNPVTDLTADDFEVRENGRPRDIAAFAAVNLPIEPPAPLDETRVVERDVVTNAKPPARRYLFALDEVAPDRALRARHILRRFIQDHLGPNDVAAVALTGRGLASSGQDFTSDKQLVLAAIEKFSGGFESADGETGTAIGSDARQLASSLRQLTEFLATMPGRKVLVYVGEGLAGIDVFDIVDYKGGALTPASIDAHEAIAAATRSNVTIYPLDPRGLTTDLGAAEEFDTSQLETRQDLSALAAVTGGFAITNTNDMGKAFDRIVRESSVYYTIGFSSENDRRDGRFVPVSVQVKRPGLQVRSRTGYVSPLREERRPPPVEADARLATVAGAIASPVATSGVPIRVFAAPYRAGKDKASIAIAIEIDPSPLGLELRGDVFTGQVEVSYLATDARGKVRPGRRHTATASITREAMERTSGAGLRVISEFELPHGRYQLRVAAGSATVAGSVVYDLEVPDFGKGPLSLSGVSLTSNAAARISTVAARAPLSDVLPAPPTAMREFGRDDTLVAYAEVYDNAGSRDGPHVIEVVSELEAEDGRVAVRTSDRRNSTAEKQRSGGHGFHAVVPLQDVEPGTYVLRITARSQRSTDQVASRAIRITVK